LKLNSFQENIYDLEEQKKLFDYDSIKLNPHLATDYAFEIIKNSSRLNLALFDKNVIKLKEKIYDIIEHKELYDDLYKILSSIYGAFLADSMGSGTEFRSKDKNNHELIYKDGGIFKPGQVTDDSEMAMSQAYGILDNYDYRNLNPNLLYYYYVLWSESNPSDIGTTTRAALINLNLNKVNITDENIFSEKIKNKISIKNSGSLANGYLMRASPLLTWFYMVNKNYVIEIIQTKSSNKYFELYKKIHEEMAKDTQLTHPNRETAIAGSIMIFMGLCSIQQKYSGKEILEMASILLENSFFEEDEIGKTLKNIFKSNLNEFSKPNFSKDDFFSNLEIQMGFYRHAFNLTIYYLSVFDEQKKEMSLKDIYTNMMFDISDFGGDTDTNGAIVGMVMGPLIGMENFDKKYFDVFLSFYSRQRILYTNVYMYFYASYIIKLENKGLIIDRNASKVNFYFMQMILEMLNNEIKL